MHVKPSQPVSAERPDNTREGAVEAFRRAVEARELTVAVVGLGYVGLPLLLAFHENGFPSLGFDIDPAKIESLEDGETYLSHIGSERVRRLGAGAAFAATTEPGRLAGAQAIILCVPTPATEAHEPDLSFVEGSARMIAEHLRPGQLIVLESTTWPGTTREVVRPILEDSGLVADRDFFLAYSPEREDPGNSVYHTRNTPKVVGADHESSLSMATALYGSVVESVVEVSSAATAEAVKLTENIFRAVNISLVNELKTVYSAMGIDVWEVIDAANTKPFGYMPFYPGPGMGGHCLPIDPFYLAWRARQFGVRARFIELAGEINTAMPAHVVDSLESVLRQRHGKSLAGARILVLGLAYKKNVDDTRESPALEILSRLIEAGADASYHDPYIPAIPRTRRYPELAGRSSAPLGESELARTDAVVICTDHDNLDYEILDRRAQLVVDTRNAMARRGFAGEHVVKV